MVEVIAVVAVLGVLAATIVWGWCLWVLLDLIVERCRS